jgi:hypothetical protein
MQVYRNISQVAHQRRERILRHCPRNPQIQPRRHGRRAGRESEWRPYREAKRRRRRLGWRLLQVHRHVMLVAWSLLIFFLFDLTLGSLGCLCLYFFLLALFYSFDSPSTLPFCLFYYTILPISKRQRS